MSNGPAHLEQCVLLKTRSDLCLAGHVFSLARLSLTPKHAKQIMQLLKRVQNWWGRQYGDDDNGVFTFLGVPLSKQQEIREQCGSDEDTAVEKCIEWWLEHATDVSWRKILYSLDWAIETPVADSIRQYAEPPSGYY